ncbi:ATP-binding cassette, subfamily B [Hathewaya proteolytica DSM 3090]|uniref:ATP-binding cassette, subfamily B n=1 Tax=Hathewaya proteolytica DSM 3090 TaxID=1121331 RepID=A0A1M6N6K5_9CLOT|nr:ABC transporter ATP-binding protein [Hathewaya proteolytica]SHJ91186.1 ATP-binding cassette, subfamily B [Hathewaya proteolytica DSM 3090]
MKSEIKSYFKLLSKYLKAMKLQVIFLGVVLACSVGLQLVIPKITGYFIDSATKGAPMKILIFAATSFIVLAIIQQVLALVSTYVAQVVGWNASNELRIDLIRQCLNLDSSFHKSYKQGELIERIDGDVTALFNFFSKLMLNLLNNIVLILGILVMLFFEGISVGISITSFVIISVAIFIKIQKKAVPIWTENRKITSELYGMLGESIGSTEDIRTNGAVSYFINCYDKFLKKNYKIERKSSMMYYYMWSSSIILFAMGTAVALGLGGVLMMKGSITIGSVYIIFQYTELLNRPVNQIRFQLEDLQKAGASIKRIEELFNKESKLKDGHCEVIMEDKISLDLEKVSFSYEDGKRVLYDISFKVPSGNILGILGRTGSGKTTLARLIARLYDPESGNIKFNNYDIKDIKLENLRKNIAYVTQDVQIFCATVRDNITLFNPNIEDDKIMAIIDDMGLRGWVDKLPQGLNTMLQADGGGLSAGEAQLLAFVRVFLKDPKVVILDEASSRLDPVTEGLMENALKKLLDGRTCIIIAHRLATVERADQIMVLSQGRVVENGDREELLRDKSSKFHELLEKGIEEVLA